MSFFVHLIFYTQIHTIAHFLALTPERYLLSLLSVLITSSTGGAALVARIAADTYLLKDGLMNTCYHIMDGCI